MEPLETGLRYLERLSEGNDTFEGEFTIESANEFFDDAFNVMRSFEMQRPVHLTDDSLIGTGAYGRVYATGNAAVKVIPYEIKYLNEEEDYLYPDKALKELYIMYLLATPGGDDGSGMVWGIPGIVTLQGFSRMENALQIHMELGGVSLASMLYDTQGEASMKDWEDTYIGAMNRRSLLDDDSIVQYVEDIITGVKYMHRLEILHGDIKPLNLLVKDDGSLALCDFGSSMLLTEGQCKVHYNILGTERYNDPDALAPCGNNPRIYTKGSDWWSVGCVIAEMVTGLPMVLAESIQARPGEYVPDPFRPIVEWVDKVLSVQHPLACIRSVRLRKLALEFLRVEI
jgi:serine/threonine protein kinase